MRIQLGWGHLLVIFISHYGFRPNNRNLSAQKSIGFDRHRSLIVKWPKPMRGDVIKSFTNRMVWFSNGFIEGYSLHKFHQFGGRCCAGSESFNIINIYFSFCLSGLHCFSASNISFCLIARRHGGNVISYMAAKIMDCSSDTISDFPFFPDFYLDVNYFKADMILARSLPF